MKIHGRQLWSAFVLLLNLRDRPVANVLSMKQSDPSSETTSRLEGPKSGGTSSN